MITISVMLSNLACACSIPVFRYALDYWSADPYEVLVYHQGSLSAEDQALIGRIKSASSDSISPANVTIKTIGFAEPLNESTLKMLEVPSASELPWMVVKYPKTAGISKDIWSGKLTSVEVEALLDSPIRREIAQRILDGQAGVWLLLESGDSQSDEATAVLLEAQVEKMSEEMRIQLPEWNIAQNALMDDRVEFSMLRVSPDDVKERFLIQMLINSEWDLENTSSPIAFPIFGRGRILYALVGDGINAKNIEKASSFLVGWCSCQVKDLNPGIDLLISANWGEVKEYQEEVGAYVSTLNEDKSTLKRNIVIVVLIQVVVIAIVALVVLMWKKRSRNRYSSR